MRRYRGSVAAPLVVAALATVSTQIVAPLALAERAPIPAIIRTVPSDTVGGLPMKSLDGTKEYLPVPAAQPEPTRAGRTAHTRDNAWIAGATGYDISWPNCPAHNPVLPPASKVAVVGVNDGTPFTALPCMRKELAWSPAGTHALYMVLDSPIGSTSARALRYADHGPAGACTAAAYDCQAFNWGYNAATYAVQTARSAGATSKVWWLDVELPTSTSINPPGAHCYAPNFWTCDGKVNSSIVLGAVTSLKLRLQTVGIYSTQYQWGKITNGLRLNLPIWIAGYDHPAATYCDPAGASADWFAKGRPWLVQSVPGSYDPDTAC